MSHMMRIFNIVFILVLFGLIITSCGGGGGGQGGGYSTSGGSGGGNVINNSTSFTGYVYTPKDRSLRSEPSRTGLVVLQDNNVPEGYRIVPDAQVFPEDNPGLIITTDSSGKFTFDFGRGRAPDADKTRLIIKPTGDSAIYSPIIQDVYPRTIDPANVKKLILFPAARNIGVGEVGQFYAKGVMTDGHATLIPPELVTWQVDNENIATISSKGVVKGIGPGSANVTISMGNLSCTGRVHVRSSQPTYTLSGTISDSSGKLISDAIVSILNVPSIAISDGSGAYVLPGLPGNTYLTIMVFYQGTLRYINTIKLAGDTVLNIILLNQPVSEGSIQGTVTDNSQSPLEGVLVSNGWSDTLTDATGNYVMEGIPATTYMFTFSKNGYVPVDIYCEIKGGQTTYRDIVMQPAAQPHVGILNGRVENTSGKGLGGVEVSYSARNRFPGRGSATTDSNGFFSFADVPPGTYLVRASGPAYQDTYADATVTAGGETHIVIVMMGLLRIEVTPTNPSIPKGLTQQFIATAIYENKGKKDVTAFTWQSSNPDIATIDPNGRATAIKAGTTTITASDPASGVSGSATLTITNATLVSIQVTPTNPSIPLGVTQQFTATGTYTDNTTQDITASATWLSSDSGVANISNAAGTEGLATSLSTGFTDISAALGGTTSPSSRLTVTSAELVSIQVTPTNPSIPLGLTQQFTATGIFTDNSNQDITSSVLWESLNTGIAIISTTAGSEGLATSVNTGSATMRATDTATGINGTTTLQVTPAELVSIAVTPANPSIAKGLTQQFVATGTYTDNSTQDITAAVTWESLNLGVATISNAGGSEGLATSVTTGSANIRATDPATGINGTTLLQITAAELVSIAVTPANPSIPKGLTQQFAATGTYTDNSTQNLTSSVTWGSSNTNAATISNAAGTEGLATSVNVDSTVITAIDPSTGKSNSTNLTVTAAELVSIQVTPTNPSIAKGLTQQFTATGTYTDNSTQNITTAVTWESLNTNVATISNAAGSEGLATSVNTGSTTIRATDSGSGINGTTALTVTDAELLAIAVTPINPSVEKKFTSQFTATGTFTDNSTQNITTSVTWQSSAPSYATISNAAGSKGLATGVSVGISIITATDTTTGINGSTNLSVTSTIDWERNYGGSGQESYCQAEQTIDGGYIIAGWTFSPADGDITGPISGTCPWIVKLDSAGNIIWDKCYNGKSYVYSLQQTTDGGFIIAGVGYVTKLDSSGNITWEKSHSASVRSVQQTTDGGFVAVGWVDVGGFRDTWVVKLDASGNTTWERNYGGSSHESGMFIQQTIDGGYIVASHTASSGTGDVSGINHGSGTYDLWIVKLDSLGNLIWERNYGGSAQETARKSVQQTSDGGYIVACETTSSASGDVSGLNKGGTDIWVIKLDTLGNIIWERNYGGSGNETYPSIKQTTDGGYIFIGGTSSSASGDVSGIYDATGGIWVVKLDPLGNIIWERTYGGSAGENSDSIEPTADGGYIIGGSTSSSASGDVSGISRGSSDYWVIKLKP